MDLTFFFSHERQDPNGGWVAFVHEESHTTVSGRVGGAVEGPLRLSVFDGSFAAGIDSLQDLDASLNLPIAPINAQVLEYTAEIPRPLLPARLREKCRWRLPSPYPDSEVEVETHYPRRLGRREQIDTTYVGQYDASSGNWVGELLATPVSFDLDDPHHPGLVAIYGPPDTWPAAPGVHVSQLLDDPLLAEIWARNPYLLRLDGSASGYHYLLSADSTFFTADSTEVNFPREFALTQLIDGYFVNCLLDEIAYLYIADLPRQVAEYYGIFHDLSDLASDTPYSHVWLRLFAESDQLLEFERPAPDLENPFPPAALHAVRRYRLRREHTDVPPETVSDSFVFRFEADQTAFGFADADYLYTNSTEVYKGELWPQGAEAWIRSFPIGADTAWLTADVWAATADSTHLLAGSYEQTYYVDDEGEVIVQGWEPPDWTPPPLPPPSTSFEVDNPPPIPPPSLGCGCGLTADMWIYPTLDLSLFSTVWAWAVHIDASSDICASTDFIQTNTTYVLVGSFQDLAHFLNFGLPQLNWIWVTADAWSITAADWIYIGTVDIYVPGAIEVHRLLLISADTPLTADTAWVTAGCVFYDLELWGWAQLYLWLASTCQDASDGIIYITAASWVIPDGVTADTLFIAHTQQAHPIDASCAWITADRTVTADTTVLLAWFATEDLPPLQAFYTDDGYYVIPALGVYLLAPWPLHLGADSAWVTADTYLPIGTFPLPTEWPDCPAIQGADGHVYILTLQGPAALPLPGPGEWQIHAGSGWVVASLYLTTDSTTLVVVSALPPPPCFFRPRLCLPEKILKVGLEELQLHGEISAAPGDLHLDVSMDWILASYWLVLTNDTCYEVVWDLAENVQPESLPPSSSNSGNSSGSETTTRTPGGPYVAIFHLPPYLYPTFQTEYPVSADLDFLVNASTWLTADSLTIQLPGVLTPERWMLITWFPVRSDAWFTVDQDWLTADAFEAIFELHERRLLPQACFLPPGHRPLTADTTELEWELWHNPWWLGRDELTLKDWTQPADVPSVETPLTFPRGDAAWVERETFFSIENVPRGRRRMEIPTSCAWEQPLLPSSVLDWQMPGAWLHELAWGLLALKASGRDKFLALVLARLVHFWAVELNNLIQTADGPQLNDAVTWGLPSYLARDPGPQGYSHDRDVDEMAWLGLALVQVIAYLRDRPAHTRVDLPEGLLLLLRQLAYLVANAVDPVSGWTFRRYSEVGTLEGGADFVTTVLACLFLSEYLTLHYDEAIHARAAAAWLAIADSPAIPTAEVYGLEDRSTGELCLYKLLWALRFGQQLDVETLVEAYLQEPTGPLGLFDLVARDLRLDVPKQFFPRSWGQVWGDTVPRLADTALQVLWESRSRLFDRPAFSLGAAEAWAHVSMANQLLRWMWPYGYHWLSLTAEKPGGGDLGALLYAVAFLSFYWALQALLLQEGVTISTAQGLYLDTWGQTLALPRPAGQSDDYYRQRLLGWYRLSGGTPEGLLYWVEELHESPGRLEDDWSREFAVGWSERRGGLRNGRYDPYIYIYEPWQGRPEEVERLLAGGSLQLLTADYWEIDASTTGVYLPAHWPTRERPDAPIVLTPVTADTTLLDWRVGRPAFRRPATADNNTIDASETWLGADTAELILYLDGSYWESRLYTRSVSEEMLLELPRVVPIGVPFFLVGQPGGRVGLMISSSGGQAWLPALPRVLRNVLILQAEVTGPPLDIIHQLTLEEEL